MGASKRRKTSVGGDGGPVLGKQNQWEQREQRDGGHQPDKTSKTATTSTSTTRTTMQLNEGEACVVVGRGALVVLQGHVRVHGKVLRGKEDGSVRLPLACDAACPVCVQSLGGGLAEGKGIPYAAARYAEVAFEEVEVEHVAGAFEHFFPAEWTEVAEQVVSTSSGVDPGSLVQAGHDTGHDAGHHLYDASAGNNLFVAVVCGSKNTGKSSFSRYLVNSLLNAHRSIMYLDMDCGQPEYTPPGLVSLFEVTEPMIEPTYLKRYERPLASHFIGDTSPGTDPGLYERSVSNLFSRWAEWKKATETAKRRRKDCKQEGVMVINTHGWIQGLGLDVLCRFLEKVAVGARQVALVRMQAENPRHNLPEGLFFMGASGGRPGEHIHVRDYHLPAISSGCASCVAAKRVRDALGFSKTKQAANATEKRVMQWHNFARHCCPPRGISEGANALDASDAFDALEISRRRPCRIGLDAVTLSFFEGFVPKDDDRAMQSLNGCVVGLCDSPDDGDIAMCYGVGIVRSVCVRTRSLYVLTPVPLVVLTAHVDHIVVGRICDLPNSLLAGSPYLAVGCIVGGGGGVRSSRGNLIRKSQFEV